MRLFSLKYKGKTFNHKGQALTVNWTVSVGGIFYEYKAVFEQCSINF